MQRDAAVQHNAALCIYSEHSAAASRGGPQRRLPTCVQCCSQCSVGAHTQYFFFVPSCFGVFMLCRCFSLLSAAHCSVCDMVRFGAAHSRSKALSFSCIFLWVHAFSSFVQCVVALSIAVQHSAAHGACVFSFFAVRRGAVQCSAVQHTVQFRLVQYGAVGVFCFFVLVSVSLFSATAVATATSLCFVLSAASPGDSWRRWIDEAIRTHTINCWGIYRCCLSAAGSSADR